MWGDLLTTGTADLPARPRRTDHPGGGHVAGESGQQRVPNRHKLNGLSRASRRVSSVVVAGDRPAEHDDEPEAGRAYDGDPHRPAVDGHHPRAG